MLKRIWLTAAMILIFGFSGCKAVETDNIGENNYIEIESVIEADIVSETEENAKAIGGEFQEEVCTVEDEETSLTLVMVGDMLMHAPVNETGVMEDGSIDFSHLFTYTEEKIQGADIALVNQEVILGGEELGISGR